VLAGNIFGKMNSSVTVVYVIFTST